jgi:DNA repair protein RadC
MRDEPFYQVNMDNSELSSLRPREKLHLRGAASLADEELLALIIGSGNKNYGVELLARTTLRIIDERNGLLEPRDLQSIPGIGPAKAASIAAAMEFVRRRVRPEGVKIRSPEDILPLISHMADKKQEHLIAISLNGAHEVIATRVVTIGLANSSQVHPREVFAEPMTDRACAVIVAHNHPSGDLTPSKEDLMVTERLEKAADILGIKLLDHLVFSKRGIRSVRG